MKTKNKLEVWRKYKYPLISLFIILGVFIYNGVSAIAEDTPAEGTKEWYHAQIKSQGQITYVGEDKILGTADDVHIFDSKDFHTLIDYAFEPYSPDKD